MSLSRSPVANEPNWLSSLNLLCTWHVCSLPLTCVMCVREHAKVPPTILPHLFICHPAFSNPPLFSSAPFVIPLHCLQFQSPFVSEEVHLCEGKRFQVLPILHAGMCGQIFPETHQGSLCVIPYSKLTYAISYTNTHLQRVKWHVCACILKHVG